MANNEKIMKGLIIKICNMTCIIKNTTNIIDTSTINNNFIICSDFEHTVRIFKVFIP